MPEKLHELQRLWLIEAVRYNVLPLDDDVGRRLNSDLAGRPVLIKSKTQLLFGGMGRLSENSVVNIKNKSHAVTAEIVVPEGETVEVGTVVAYVETDASAQVNAVPAPEPETPEEVAMAQEALQGCPVEAIGNNGSDAA